MLIDINRYNVFNRRDNLQGLRDLVGLIFQTYKVLKTLQDKLHSGFKLTECLYHLVYAKGDEDFAEEKHRPT